MHFKKLLLSFQLWGKRWGEIWGANDFKIWGANDFENMGWNMGCQNKEFFNHFFGFSSKRRL